MYYTLNATEEKLADFIVRQRIEYNNQTHAKPTVYTNESLYDNNLQAYGGEIAFCKLFNVYPDLDFQVRHVEDAVVDGWTIDVKTTRNPHGVMYVKRMERKQGYPDFYAMMIGNYPTYEFKGFISSEEMIQEHRIKEFPKYNSASYVARQSELRFNLPRRYDE